MLKSFFNSNKVVIPVLHFTGADASANSLWHEREHRASPGGDRDE